MSAESSPLTPPQTSKIARMSPAVSCCLPSLRLLLNELRFSDPYRNEKHVANALNGPGPVITVVRCRHVQWLERGRRCIRGESSQPQRQSDLGQRGAHDQSGRRGAAKSGRSTCRYVHSIHISDHRHLSRREIRCQSSRLHHLPGEHRDCRRRLSLPVLELVCAG